MNHFTYLIIIFSGFEYKIKKKSCPKTALNFIRKNYFFKLAKNFALA